MTMCTDLRASPGYSCALPLQILSPEGVLVSRVGSAEKRERGGEHKNKRVDVRRNWNGFKQPEPARSGNLLGATYE